MRRFVIPLLGLGGAILIGIQFVPVARTNPPVEPGFDAPDPVKEVLRKACFDCHSHETRWPWYSRVAPVSWLVAGDVRDARRKLNFSTWGSYSADKRSRKIGDAWDEVAAGEMPLRSYRWLHSAARLDDADKAVLRAWAQAEEKNRNDDRY